MASLDSIDLYIYNNVVSHTVELVDFKNPNKRERKKASLLTDGSMGDRLANALASNPETEEETPPLRSRL